MPGEAEAAQVMELLRLGQAGGRPVRDVLAVASGPAGPGTATRLWLKAEATSDDGKDLKADDAVRQRVRQVLADPAQVQLHTDVLINSAPDIVCAMADERKGRKPFVVAFKSALLHLQAEPGLRRTQPEAMLRDVRRHAANFDREITDGYERQAMVPYVACALQRAGLWEEGEALLRANLARSHALHDLRSQLGGMARRLGRPGEAARLSGAFYKRSAGSMKRVGCAGTTWSNDRRRAASVKRLQAKLGAPCRKVEVAHDRQAA